MEAVWQHGNVFVANLMDCKQHLLGCSRIWLIPHHGLLNFILLWMEQSSNQPPTTRRFNKHSPTRQISERCHYLQLVCVFFFCFFLHSLELHVSVLAKSSLKALHCFCSEPVRIPRSSTLLRLRVSRASQLELGYSLSDQDAD